MCTLSWKYSKPTLEIHFSRDEQRTRPKALPPNTHLSGTTSILSPTDPLGGGTWLAVNNHGIATCILNDYSIPTIQNPSLKSRGLLVKTIAEQTSMEDIHDLINREISNHPYAPFTLIIWHTDNQEHTQYHWDQKKLTSQTPPQIITSSSWNTHAVETHIKNIYHNLITNKKRPLQEFHHYQDSTDLKSSVCMSREKTQTVSLTEIKITPNHITMNYAERDADKLFQKPTQHTLPR